jgi:ABC-type bacteriocin/lantibiotic exporter with double-glycine peptidase domain
MAKQFYIPDVIQNTDYDCGVECVQTILAYYGIDYTDLKLENILKVSKKFGTASKSIIDFFKLNKFKVTAGKMSVEKVKGFILKNIPVIILIQAWAERKTDYANTNNWGHYVVVCGYNKKGFIIEDPAIFGRGFISYHQLLKRWHAEDEKLLENFGIAVWGKKPYDYKKYIRIP